MGPLSVLVLLCLPLFATAVRLLVASYDEQPAWTMGALQTLEFKDNFTTLDLIDTSRMCGAQPSWIDTSFGNNKILCIDKNGGRGSLQWFEWRKKENRYHRIFEHIVLRGPVSAIYYRNKKSVALAHYYPPALHTYTFNPKHGFVQSSKAIFKEYINDKDFKTYSDTRLQQVVLDPTGDYLITPDCGLEMVHVWHIWQETGYPKIMDQSLELKYGSQPRRVAFWKTRSGKDTYMLVLHQRDNTLVSFKVTYLYQDMTRGGMTFKKVDSISTFGNFSLPLYTNASAAEIHTDTHTITVSNNYQSVFDIANPDPNNSTRILSDSLATFRPREDGTLEFLELVPSGGMVPIHFKVNAKGDKIAVANRDTRNVVVYERNWKTGKIGKQIAQASGLGPAGLSHVAWMEEEF